MDLQAAPDARAAAAAALDELGRPGAVYGESGGRLRCLAVRDRAEVADGLPVFGGAVHVAADGPVPDALVARLTARLAELGPPPPEPSLVRLARAAGRLLGPIEATLLHRVVIEVAADVAGARSALLVLVGPAGGLHVADAVGPLAAGWLDLARPALDTLQALVAESASWRAMGPACTPVAPGASQAAVAAVRREGRPAGLVVVADGATDELGTEALELLADQVGRALDLVAAVDDLRDRASRDPLTGLGNANAFRDALGAGPDLPAVVVGDVDGFDQLNRVAGHQAGDRVLRALAAVLANEVRGADRLYRVDGDRFAALLHGVDNARALAVGQRLCIAAAGVLAEHGTGLSAGVAVPAAAEPPADVLARAESAVFAAKRTAPGSCVLAPLG